MAGMAERLWWLDDPKERYWVETLSERRATPCRQLHAPQVDGSGRTGATALSARPGLATSAGLR